MRVYEIFVDLQSKGYDIFFLCRMFNRFRSPIKTRNNGEIDDTRRRSDAVYLATWQLYHKRHFMAGFVRNYFRNSFKDMVSFFAHEDKISPEELQDIIDEIETGIRN